MTVSGGENESAALRCESESMNPGVGLQQSLPRSQFTRLHLPPSSVHRKIALYQHKFPAKMSPVVLAANETRTEMLTFIYLHAGCSRYCFNETRHL